jgi:hypothetical protein
MGGSHMGNRSEAARKAAKTRKRNAANRCHERWQTPSGRLWNDGALSWAAIRRRILALAYEWKLSDDEIEGVLRSRGEITGYFLQFAKRYCRACAG